MDEDTTSEEEKEPSPKGKGKRSSSTAITDRQKAQHEPTPTRPDLFEWLERLFYAEPELAHFPDKIELVVLRGKDYEIVGQQIHIYPFGPNQEHKPSRTRLSTISNEICFLTQRDCDIQRKSVVYGVLAWDFHLKEKPIGAFKLRCQPRDEYRDGGVPRQEGEDEEEGGSSGPIGKHLLEQGLSHNRETFTMYGGALEGILDRYDRLVKRQEERIERQDERIAKQAEMIERALSLEADREDKRAMNKLKIAGAERAMDVASAILPPLVNNLFGSKVLPAYETIEVQTIKKFFGSLNEKQIEAVFGVADEKGAVIKAGVLSVPQGQLLYEIAGGVRPLEAIDALLPNGPLAITDDQLKRLLSSCGLDVELQLLPLKMIFDNRMKARGGDASSK